VIRKIFLASVLLSVSLPALAHADDYDVTVTKVDQDLYKTDTGVYIKTQYCYEFATSDDAILIYDQYSYDNKLIFTSDNASCAVTGLLH
jgi:hypothetical protein